MRVVVCGDSHIGAVFGLGRPKKDGGNTRVDDYEKSLNSIVDYAIDSRADIFVQTGDIFDSRTPSSENMEVVNRAFKKLSKNNITSVIIMGNHDYKKSGKGFTSSISSLSIKDFPNVRIVLEPQIVNISNDNDESVNLLLLPYRDKRMYDGDSIVDKCLGFSNHIKGLIGSCDSDAPIMAIGHNFFYEGSYNDYGGSELLMDINSFDGCSLVVVGHQHNFRIIKGKAVPAIYVGSMEKINFGDQNVDKFFVDYNISDDKVLVKKINTRELCDAKIHLEGYDSSNIVNALYDKMEELDIKDKIVRVRASVPESMISIVNKSNIEKKAYDLGAFYVSKIILEPITNRLVRDTSILEYKDDFAIFKAFVDAQGFSEEDSALIVKKFKEIVE